MNGQRPESNSFFVDGISADSNGGVISGHSRAVSTGSAAGATALGTTQSLVSVEALQEFRVLTSSYSAEYGRTPGGQFTFLTRSGTNTPHGSLFYNFRSNVFDAIDWFAGHGTPGFISPARDLVKTTLGAHSGRQLSCPAATTAGTRPFSSSSYEGLYLPQPTPTIRPSLRHHQPTYTNRLPCPVTGPGMFPWGRHSYEDILGNPSGLGRTS